MMGGGPSYMGSSPYMNNITPGYAPQPQSQFSQPTSVQPASYNTPYSQPAPPPMSYNNMSPQSFNPVSNQSGESDLLLLQLALVRTGNKPSSYIFFLSASVILYNISVTNSVMEIFRKKFLKPKHTGFYIDYN